MAQEIQVAAPRDGYVFHDDGFSLDLDLLVLEEGLHLGVGHPQRAVGGEGGGQVILQGEVFGQA